MDMQATKDRGLQRRRRQSGAALAEYGLLVAGITLVSLVAVTMLGSKVGGLIGSVATLLPGAYFDQNSPVNVGQLIETRREDINADGINEIVVDSAGITHEGGGEVGQNVSRLGRGLGIDNHDASHLYQLGSHQNPFDGGGQ
jgi:Flp pilus assembly pilin Flp